VKVRNLSGGIFLTRPRSDPECAQGRAKRRRHLADFLNSAENVIEPAARFDSRLAGGLRRRNSGAAALTG
jgi:hypothetical protein